MTLIRPQGVGDGLMAQVAEAEAFLRETGAFYRDLSLKAQAEGEDSPARARDRMHEYRKAAMAALEDARRVADELNRARGIVRV